MGDSETFRLAVFSGNYNNVRDGANRALNRLVGYMLDHGADVKVFSPTVDEPAFEPVGELHSLPSVPIPVRGEYKLAYSLGRKSRKVLEAFDPHLIHLSVPDFANHSAMRFGDKTGKPVVASYHTAFNTYLAYYRLNWLSGPIENLCTNFYNGCDQVYVPSSAVEETLKEMGVETPIHRWTRGINCDDFSPEKRCASWRQKMGLSPDKPIVLFVGRLVKEKGLSLMASSIAALREKGCDFEVVIAGDGPEAAYVRKELPSAHMLGHVERNALSEAYANADIFFNPSETETFGNVTLEAMASGLPCVCTRAGGTTDLVTDGVNGLLATPRDVASHTQALEDLLRNPAKRETFGQESRKLSLNRSWNTVMAELLSHYRSVLSRWYPSTCFNLS